jgi:phage-related protein
MGKNEVEIIVTAEDKASGVLRGVGGALSGIGRVAVGAALGGVAAVAGGMALAGSAAIGMNSTLETSQLQFATLMGDSDKAAEHVASLFDFAARTPFETGPILTASKHLQVFGGDALNTMDNLTLVGDASAALGVPFDEAAFWVGRLYSNLQGGQPFGEAAMRLQEMGVLAPEARTQLEEMQKAGASGTEIFGTFQGQLGTFTGAMVDQAGTWTGLTSTIKDQLSLAAAEGLKPFFDLAKEGLAALAGWLQSPEVQAGIATLRDGITTLIERVSAFVTGQVMPFVQEHGPQIITVLKILAVAFGALLIIGAVAAAMSLLLSPIGLISVAIGLLAAAWANNWGGIQEKTAAVVAFIRGLIQAFLAAIMGFWEAHGAAIVATVTRIWDLIKTLIDGAVNHIKLIVAAFIALFQGDWEAFGQAILDIWQNAWDTAVAFLSKLWGMIQPWLSSLWNSVKGWFTGTDWASLGRAVVQGIINGLRAMGDALSGAIRSIVEAAIARIKALLGIASPSKVTTEFGKMTGQGLINGILSQVGAVRGAVDTMLDAAGVRNGTLGIDGQIRGGATQGAAAGGGRMTVVNIDARGAARGVDQDLRRMVEDVLRQYGTQADMRLRTS